MMNHSFGHAKLDALIGQYRSSLPDQDSAFLHWVCIPAIMFAVLGMLFTLNFGVSLIAIGFAILYYFQFGQRIATEMAGLLLLMLAVWMLLMPAHHLIAASLGIFALALAGQVFGRAPGGRGRSFAGLRQHILAGPVYALAMFHEKLFRNPRLDPRR